MSKKDKIIFIIDDDKSVRRSLTLFLTSAGFKVESYIAAEEYLENGMFEGIGCLVLDINLGGKSGLQLQEELINHNAHLPIIFFTGKGDIRMSVLAMKQGAINFLQKPFDDGELLRSLNEALVLSEKLLSLKEELLESQNLVALLTHREIQILKHLISGLLNKQIAAELDIAEHIVKLHRQSICQKLKVKSVPEILRIADNAAIKPSANTSQFY